MKTKKKRRYLRPWIQNICTAVTLSLGVFFAMLNDFTMQAVPLLMGLAAIWVGCVYLLYNYGK